MEKFVRDEKQKLQVETATARARTWLLATEPKSQEDSNAKFQAAIAMGGTREQILAARRAVLDAQRDDGGWPQLPEMESDAYATGQTLQFLANGTDRRERDSAVENAIARALDYLLRTQEKDGSWFVKSRSKPIQKLFDNGDPHGTDQFISIAATSWAVAAMAVASDDPAPGK